MTQPEGKVVQAPSSGNHRVRGRGRKTDSGVGDRGDEVTVQVAARCDMGRMATPARVTGERRQQEPQREV